MPTSVPKRQKTTGGLGYLCINDWKNRGTRIRIGTSTLYLITCNLQELDWGPAGFKKRDQYNELGICFLARLLDRKNQYSNSENWLHYLKDLRDGSLYLFRVR